MRAVRCAVAVAIIFAASSGAQSPLGPPLPTWQDEIAHGKVPYHQLTADDFRIDDRIHPEAGYWIKPFVDYRYNFLLKPYNGFSYAYVSAWVVFSGLDKSETSRKSKFPNMKADLPYAQAFLDLCELHARELAALKPGELPGVRAETYERAKAGLEAKIKAFCQVKFDQITSEQDAFVKATNHGAHRKKVRELGAAIRKRLDAIPAMSPQPNESIPGTTATPVSSAMPKSTASPAP